MNADAPPPPLSVLPPSAPVSRPPPRRGALTRWRRGLAALADADPDMARALADVGKPPLVLRDAGFPTLLRAIVAQQVSAAAARSIWARVEAKVVPLSAEGFLALDEETVRSLGFSRQKIAYASGLAADVASGRLDLDRLVRMDDEEAIAALTAVKGIGRWTAEVYLLFALGRPDVWPALDLALVAAMQRMKGLEARPTWAEARTIAEVWRPWRSVAAIMLWHYYKAMP